MASPLKVPPLTASLSLSTPSLYKQNDRLPSAAARLREAKALEAAQTQLSAQFSDSEDSWTSEISDGGFGTWGRICHHHRQALIIGSAGALLGLIGLLVSLAVNGQVFGGEAVPPQATPSSAPFQAAGYGASQGQRSATSDILPSPDLQDGNPCGADEEYFLGLCYKKCKLLTTTHVLGVHFIRKGAQSCCRAEPCTAENTITANRLPCHGFDIAGSGSAVDDDTEKCPHSPGLCLNNEELFEGLCYKKCSDLTQGEYPHRTAVETCCRSTGFVCLAPGSTKTALSLAVGGGLDCSNKLTPCVVHPPIPALAEFSDSQT